MVATEGKALLRIEQGIFQVVFERNTILVLEDAKRIVAQRLILSGDKEYPLYIDIRGIVSIDEPTRKYLAGPEGTSKVIKAAIHVDNPISKLLGNIFLTVDNPPKPAKLFTDKIKAMKWLSTMV